jgi:hypothetical protein
VPSNAATASPEPDPFAPFNDPSISAAISRRASLICCLRSAAFIGGTLPLAGAMPVLTGETPVMRESAGEAADPLPAGDGSLETGNWLLDTGDSSPATDD